MSLRERITPRVLVLGLLLLGFLALVGTYGTWLYVSIYRKHARQAEEALEKAAMDGKYEGLLKQVRAPQDRGSYGDFRDYGYSATPSYAGYSDLPSGYWVYAYPYWHIWAKTTGPEPPQAERVVMLGSTFVASPPPVVLPPEEALKKARVGGKYQMLLRQIEVGQEYGSADAYDYGYWSSTSYAGHSDLPAGYWVYVYPHWYIWRDLSAPPRAKRPGGPEQATGEPDTTKPGDQPTAWSSATPDGQEEWLLLEYAEPLSPVAVHIHESDNPGAVSRIAVFGLDGKEVEVWAGKDPVEVKNGTGVAKVPITADFKTNRVKLYLDSAGVKGHNRIDAVGLLDATGKTHWATAAEASSTLAPPYPPPAEMRPLTAEERLAKLEEEMRQMKALLGELQKAPKAGGNGGNNGR